MSVLCSTCQQLDFRNRPPMFKCRVCKARYCADLVVFPDLTKRSATCIACDAKARRAEPAGEKG